MGFVAAYHKESPVGGDSSALTTDAFTPAVGEILVAKGQTWGGGTTSGTASGGGLTWVEQVHNSPGGFRTEARIFTAVVATDPGSITVTLSAPSSSCHHDLTVERWAGVTLAATPLTFTGSGSGTPSTSVTSTADNSVLTWCNGDESSVNPATPSYLSSAVQTGLGDGHIGSNAVFYAAYQIAGAAGSQTVGMSAPTGETWLVTGLELLAATSMSRTVSETASASDTVTRTMGYARAIADTAAAADTVTRTMGMSRTVAESAPGSDSATRAPMVYARTATETAAAVDAVSARLVLNRVITETAPADDAATTQLIWTRQITETAPSAEIVTAARSCIRTITEHAPAVDTVVATVTSPSAPSLETDLGSPTPMWRFGALNIGGAVNVNEMSHLSLDYVRVAVDATDQGSAVDPTGYPVYMAVTAPAVDPTAWVPASWERVGTVYYARVLVGPESTIGALAQNENFWVWVRIQAGIETPIGPAQGFLRIT